MPKHPYPENHGYQSHLETSTTTAKKCKLASPTPTPSQGKLVTNESRVENPVGNAMMELNKVFIQAVFRETSNDNSCNLYPLMREYLRYSMSISLVDHNANIPETFLDVCELFERKRMDDPIKNQSPTTEDNNCTTNDVPPSNIACETATSHAGTSGLKIQDGVKARPSCQIEIEDDDDDEDVSDCLPHRAAVPAFRSYKEVEPRAIAFAYSKVYSLQKCKWQIIGVGTLFIKKSTSANCFQFIVRADNGCENIILDANFTQESLVKRQDNDLFITLLCVDKPNHDQFLFKMTSAEECLDLLGTLQTLNDQN